ncbi:CASP8 and FADD-like apoptosis regulator [Hoplias malabaricus]|uniref:CASP8 and FADD-like apoptosis regulator n=1 Tax=Hoplias malabaricus TaxID=27720 RepID=UPI003461EBFC
MPPSSQLSEVINRIVEELNSEECKRLSYLCGTLNTGQRMVSLRDMLKSLMDQLEMDHVFLMELMLRMKRYDLLKCVLGTTKSEAEGLLQNGRNLCEYRVLMAELSEDVDSADLESLVFLLSETLPKEKLEKFESFLDIVVELEKLDQISSSRMDVMEKYLKAIHRADLVKRLHKYQSRAERAVPSQTKQKEEWRPFRAEPTKPLSRPLPTSCGTRPDLSKPCASATVIQRPSSSRPCERLEEVYRMERCPRGLCVIIDCVGTEGVLLQQVFESLHFSVSVHSLLSVQDMRSTLTDVSRQRSHYEADAFVCCVISRTWASDLLGTNTCGSGLSLDSVRSLFSSDHCPGLAGKPKLFFIQGYKVSSPAAEEGHLETDAPIHSPCRTAQIPADADVFWSHCWTQEQQLETVNHHSVYLRSLRDALQRRRTRRINLQDVHVEVNRAVYEHNRGNSSSSSSSSYYISLKHTLRRQVYFS